MIKRKPSFKVNILYHLKGGFYGFLCVFRIDKQQKPAKYFV